MDSIKYVNYVILKVSGIWLIFGISINEAYLHLHLKTINHQECKKYIAWHLSAFFRKVTIVQFMNFVQNFVVTLYNDKLNIWLFNWNLHYTI